MHRWLNLGAVRGEVLAAVAGSDEQTTSFDNEPIWVLSLLQQFAFCINLMLPTPLQTPASSWELNPCQDPEDFELRIQSASNTVRCHKGDSTGRYPGSTTSSCRKTWLMKYTVHMYSICSSRTDQISVQPEVSWRSILKNTLESFLGLSWLYIWTWWTGPAVMLAMGGDELY